ncbi:GNAT family N-acetyltransferase [Arvimicrobium flavum]|uniref:GNAT family N-acetyltransferase n=1 Tax=Arvimicrobium flavum TaxID=3393320 RepID=UPI00237ABAA9|nr:GNAT family N-acetyltransferase [Mesorhizobium shangrilense]
MVDIATPTRGEGAAALPCSVASIGPVDLAVGSTAPLHIATYASLAADGIAAPAQTAEWIGCWIKNAVPDCVIATITAEGRPVWSLALEIVPFGPVRCARFMGGKHANGNFPAGDRQYLPSLSRAQVESLCEAIGRARPDIDLLWLERLAPEIEGVRNPLLQLDHSPSPNLALAVTLTGGFDAVLKRGSAKRRQKKHRSQTRKFEAAGGFRRVQAESPQEIDRLLDAFFAMKGHRFRKMGVADAFGEEPIRAFFRDLFRSGLVGNRRFVLHGLEVAGRLRAVTGSSTCGDRLVCEFGAIAEDDVAHASPGDFLFFENIREAADGGFALYDFSVGDEPYKRLWCDTEITHYDVLQPLTLRGRAYALALRASNRTKGVVKNNPLFWRVVKWLRRRSASSPLPGAESDDRSGG